MTVSIPNNDDDEAPYTFTVQGTGIEPEYPDTDGDGAPDYLEQALGTGVSDPADNPASRGYKVAILSEGSGPVPSTLSFTFTPALSAVDVFILMDTTGSMDEGSRAPGRARIDSSTCARRISPRRGDRARSLSRLPDLHLRRPG